MMSSNCSANSTTTISTNELVEISMISNIEDSISDPFSELPAHSPLFTYPFFGEEESVTRPTGSDSKILLVVDTGLRDHRAYFLSSNRPGDAELEEHCRCIEGKLEEFAEKAGFQLERHSSWESFKTAVQGSKSVELLMESSGDVTDLVKSESPLAEAVHLVPLRPSTDAAHAALFQRLQVLLPFYIEAATMINCHSDSNWSIFLLISQSAGVIAFATCYAYFYFPSGFRQRVSQVLVLPEHQHLRHGARLYAAILAHFQADPECHEICVEDPTDRFERMRGAVELPAVKKATIDEGRTDTKAIAQELKIPLMQVRRLSNVLLHHCVPAAKKTKAAAAAADNDAVARIDTKKWLFKRFAADLDGIEGAERKAKLNELYQVELEEFIYPLLDRVCD